MKLCAGVGFVNFYEMIFLENILLPQHEFLQSQVRQTISTLSWPFKDIYVEVSHQRDPI